MSSYPKVTIEYCAKCKWHNRAIWYVQEILQTFSKPGVNLVEEVSVQPRYDFPGLFKVVVFKGEGDGKVVYQRKFKDEVDVESYVHEGFPESKFLKTLIRDYLFPENGLGHIDRGKNSGLTTGEDRDDVECVKCKDA